MKYGAFLFWVLACLACSVGKAQEKIFVVDSVKEGYNMNDFAYFYEDTTNSLTFEQINAPAFLPKIHIFGSPAKVTRLACTYWYKVKITNQCRQVVDFVFEPSYEDYIYFYVLDAQNKLVRTAKAGGRVPFSQRAWFVKKNSLPVTIAYQDTVTLWAKAIVKDERHSFKYVWLGTQRPYYEGYIYEIPHQLFFQGAILLMFAYNLLFFFMVRDKAYMYYAVYTLSLSLYFVQQRVPDYFFTREYPDYADLLGVTSLLITLFYLQFIRHFLRLSLYAPRLNQFAQYWFWGRLGGVVILVYLHKLHPQSIWLDNIVNSLVLIDLLLGVWLLLASWRQDKIILLCMILGYLAIFIPIFLLVTEDVFRTSYPPEIIQVGVLIELMLFSLGLGYRSRQESKEKIATVEENKRIIQEQNTFLEEKVEARTLELNQQKEAIEEQANSIMENITYARRIQEAFLPTEETIGKYVQNFFILFKPRDVVSGDFYFVEEVAGKVVVGAIDCTGHGVSGAFMTMLGNDILHNLVDNQFITSPDLLLNELHKGVRQALKQAETDNRDGMDVALISIDYERQKVQYAGAKNPLIYIQNGELHIIKADKMPIGGEQKEQERIFSKTEIDIRLPTMFYLFSDGFQDQFGGEMGKKFTQKRLRELFLYVQEMPLPAQKEILAKNFEAWQAQTNEPQTDDVLVIGVRL